MVRDLLLIAPGLSLSDMKDMRLEEFRRWYRELVERYVEIRQ